nr:MAG TPA: hypothetical protein [Caudoviricetes sp.]
MRSAAKAQSLILRGLMLHRSAVGSPKFAGAPKM